MALTRSTGLLLGLAFTLAATWYAAGMDGADDGLLNEPASASRATPMPPRVAATSRVPDAPGSTPAAPREGLAGEGEGEVRMDGSVGNLFATHSWNPPPPPPPMVAVREPPPTAPALPFRYVGRMEEDGAVVVFLAEGPADARPRLVRQGDQWPNYRVDEITAQGMRLTYLPLNQTQRMLFGSLN